MAVPTKECLGRQSPALMHLRLQCRLSRAGQGRVKGRCRGWGGGQQPICRGQEATPSSQVRSNAVGTKGQKGREIDRDAVGGLHPKGTPHPTLRTSMAWRLKVRVFGSDYGFAFHLESKARLVGFPSCSAPLGLAVKAGWQRPL